MSSVGTGLTSLCRSPVKPSAVELRDVTWVRLLSAPSLADAGARSRYESILSLCIFVSGVGPGWSRMIIRLYMSGVKKCDSTLDHLRSLPLRARLSVYRTDIALA
jgi:hypothetical protein